MQSEAWHRDGFGSNPFGRIARNGARVHPSPMAPSGWALPELNRSAEDRRIYAAVEKAVECILDRHDQGEFDVTSHPDLLVLVRIIYPGFHVLHSGALAVTKGASLP